jgi:hypothetical protein
LEEVEILLYLLAEALFNPEHSMKVMEREAGSRHEETMAVEKEATFQISEV